METLGNIYGNGSRHVTQRVKLTETLNWESLFIPSQLSSCWSTNSPVGELGHSVAVEQLPEHELACGSEPVWERGEGEAVSEQ
jgi:hypothetical protein